MKSWEKFPVGSSHRARVRTEDIKDSDPCNKNNCMLSRAVIYLLVSMYGKKFKVKSTNHGLVLDIKDRRIVFVFDTATAKRIWTYDQTFKKTKSRSAAWQTVRPFWAKLMVESNTQIPKWPAMSAETKEKLRKRRETEPRPAYHPTRETARRELSL